MLIKAALRSIEAIAMGVAGVGEAQLAERERIVEIWTCNVSEGSTIDDVGRITASWNELIRSAGATDARSFILSHPIETIRGHETASDVTTSFLFLDSFLDVARWAAAKRAEEASEGQELVSTFNRANTRTANTLYRGRQYN